jgi:hypothetical protein
MHKYVDMKKYSLWLEEKKYDKAKDFLLSYLDLDKEKGVSQSLDGFDKSSVLNKLKDTNFYADISERAREKIENILNKQNSGTVGDLIRAATL